MFHIYRPTPLDAEFMQQGETALRRSYELLDGTSGVCRFGAGGAHAGGGEPIEIENSDRVTSPVRTDRS